LDRPLHEQFFDWVWHTLRGDLGTSMFSNLPVTTLVMQRAEPTIALTITTLTVAITLAITFGVLAAWKAGSLLDRAVMAFAVPVFVVGYLLIYTFSMQLRLLPVQGYVSIFDGPWPWLQRLILPSVALGLAYVALIARITRASMLEVLAEDYIRTANAKGV